jgi:hypothetical protein
MLDEGDSVVGIDTRLWVGQPTNHEAIPGIGNTFISSA